MQTATERHRNDLKEKKNNLKETQNNHKEIASI